MATEAQVLANQQNAKQSTGPRTDEGKEHIRENAVTHGLTCKNLTPAMTNSPAYGERLERLTAEFRPKTEHQLQMLRIAVGASVQADTARDMLYAEVERLKETATHGWASFRRQEAMNLLAKIHRNPVGIASQLEQSVAGCQLLIENWTRLKNAAAEPGGWDDEECSRAFDLLGVHKHNRRGASEVVPKDKDTAPITQEDLCIREIARLGSEITSRGVDAEASEQKRYIKGKSCPATPLVMRLMRYESEAARRYMKATKTLEKELGTPTVPKTQTPAPTPIIAPIPTPTPEIAPEPSAPPILKESPFRRLEGFALMSEDEVDPRLNAITEEQVTVLGRFRFSVSAVCGMAHDQNLSLEQTMRRIKEISESFRPEVMGVLNNLGLKLKDIDRTLFEFLDQFGVAL